MDRSATGTHEIGVAHWGYTRLEGFIAKQARAEVLGLANGMLVPA